MGLVARHVEAAGIPTLCMSSALDITRAVNPPRSAFLDFPLGHTAGTPRDPEMQRRILAGALACFSSMTVPGSVHVLPFRWPGDERWKETAFAGGDDRRPRHETPQYQEEEDRRRAEGAGPAGCTTCRS